MKKEMNKSFTGMYVARDENGGLCLFIGKPRRGPVSWIDDNGGFLTDLPYELWPEITWETDPVEASLLLK